MNKFHGFSDLYRIVKARISFMRTYLFFKKFYLLAIFCGFDLSEIVMLIYSFYF